jgi:uncharacterized protein YbjT (DUF2867 family)
MIKKRICILGGTGFVGQTLANQLSDAGYRIRILTRHREASRRDLIVLPKLELIETDIHSQESLNHHFKNCDVVINLVGILNERGRKGLGFHHAHVALAEKILEACHQNKIRRVLQMSALNANAEDAPSHYLRSKGEAETVLQQDKSLQLTCFRPSVIFGKNDSFFNRFVFLLKTTPLVFPLACPRALFAPVWVEDVARAFVQSINDKDSFGEHYCLCGPNTYSLRELVEYTRHCLNIRRKLIPLSDGLSRLQAALFDFVPGKPFSTDNYLSTKVDSVCKNNDLLNLGITPTALEAIVPRYLSAHNQRARYQEFRKHSRRSSIL